MAISFPTTLDVLTNPTGTSTLNSPDHATQHSNANDIVEALEAKIGINSSTVTASIDYWMKHTSGVFRNEHNADGTHGMITATNTEAGALKTQVRHINSSKDVGTGGRISFRMLDSASAVQSYGRISTEIDVNTAGSEDGTMRLSVIGGGAFDDILIIDGSTKATTFAGAVIGDLTGNCSGSSGSCTGQSATVATIAGLAPNTATTQATQSAITSLGTLTGLTMGGNIVMGDNSITGIDTLTFTDTAGTIAGIANGNLLDKSATEAISGAYTFNNGSIILEKNNGINNSYFFNYYSSPAGNYVNASKSRGTKASPTALASGDSIFNIDARGYVGDIDTWQQGARIRMVVDGTPQDNPFQIPMRISFWTAPATNDGAVVERMRIDSAGLITITQGQLKFPSTQVPSADANTLDDYEEGTWTPTITFGGGSTGVTYAVQSGEYTKIGRMITLTGFIQLTSKGSSTGIAKIGGLPFTSKNSNGTYSAVTLETRGITFANVISGYVLSNDTSIILRECLENGTSSELTNADFTANSILIINVSYFE